jgi:flagellar motility protein MotE (MotC chaperone)
VNRRGQEGSSPIGSILGTLIGGGILLVVLALFMTGLAQREILPRIKQRAENTMARAAAAVKPGKKGAAADSTGAAVGGATSGSVAGDSTATTQAQRDSLQALSVQLETQKSFLAGQEAELKKMRAGMDSLGGKSPAVDDAARKKQAKLLAAMKPAEAARVLSAMDDETVAMLLDVMNAKAAAKVMAQLDAVRVARLTTRALHKGELTGLVTPAGQEAGPATR